MAVASNFAYVADQEAGLRVISVANPAAPVEIGFFDTQYAQGVAVGGNYAYIADWHFGLVVINIASPAAPVQVGLRYPGVCLFPRCDWELCVCG